MKKIIPPLFIGIFFAFPAFAQSALFNIDASYDENGRKQVSAEIRYEGVNSRWYVENDYWSNLNNAEQVRLSLDIKALSDEFDGQIYPRLRALFGSENNPGVDNDPKVIVLVLKMIEEAGGYMREQDGLSKDQITNSNGREMLYLNAKHIVNMRAKAFLAHEFQHLITFNQKFIKHGKQEEVWVNELRSEIASTILGYDDPQFYGGSNLEARVKKFLNSPSDAILDWENESKDYATINLFGQYLLDHYGRSVIAAMIANDKVGIASLNEALKVFGFSEDFDEVFHHWTIAALVNDCATGPKYCYKNPSLGYSDFRIQFNIIEGSGEEIASQSRTKDWKANWLKLEKQLNAERPTEHIFLLQFYGPLGSEFRVPYIVYGADGKTVLKVSEVELDEGVGSFFVEDFGYKIPKVVIIPYNQIQQSGTTGSAALVSYTFNASTIDEATRVTHFVQATTTPESATSSVPNFPDGSLIRAEGDYKVYIIKDGYKRWIQSADIFSFYGHLGFGVVNVMPQEQVALYKDAWLVRAEGDFKVYEINGDGTRHWLDISAEEFNASGRSWDMVYAINRSEFLWYKEGPAVK